MTIKMTADGRPWTTHVFIVEQDGDTDIVYVTDGQDVNEIRKQCEMSGRIANEIDLGEE